MKCAHRRPRQLRSACCVVKNRASCSSAYPPRPGRYAYLGHSRGFALLCSEHVLDEWLVDHGGTWAERHGGLLCLGEVLMLAPAEVFVQCRAATEKAIAKGLEDDNVPVTIPPTHRSLSNVRLKSDCARYGPPLFSHWQHWGWQHFGVANRPIRLFKRLRSCSIRAWQS